MQIWLKQDGESLRLPVLPQSFEVSGAQQNTSVNITSFGEINLIGKRGLKTLSLSSFFPNQKYTFVQYKSFPEPYECVEMIESWKENPVRVIITGTNISMRMSIESFSHSERDGTGDVYYTIELKEYRVPPKIVVSTATIDKSSTTVTAPDTTRSTKTVSTTNYTVKSGDSLYAIAKRLTGNGNNCYAIANQNNIKSPYTIYPNQKLVIKI